MPRNFGLKRKERNDLIVAAEHAIIAEGIAVIVGFLGFAVWINAYSIWQQLP